MEYSDKLGPFSYDVYLAFCFADINAVSVLQKNLEKTGLKCIPRYEISEAVASIQSVISEGISHSRKVLMYVTEKYLDDDWCTHEITKVLEKSNRFSRDVVVVLKHKTLQQIPEQLKQFSSTEVTDENLRNEEFAGKLQKELMREPNYTLITMPKENIGHGAAFGYFYGYLRLVLPDLRKRLLEDTLRGKPDVASRTVKKMLIIMPETCFCPPSIELKDRIEHSKMYVVRNAHRAGNENRDYKSSIYWISDPQSEDKYYFIAELATPLLTMFEMYHFGLSGMTRDQLYLERDAFYVTLKAILNHEDNKNCSDQFELLFWKSDPGIPETSKTVESFDDISQSGSANESKVVELHKFLLPVVKNLLERERIADEQKSLQTVSGDSTEITGTQSLPGPVANRSNDLTTFIGVDVAGPHPGAIYEIELLRKYPMNRKPRGICLVINVSSFDKNPSVKPLNPRGGSERDTEIMKNLFSSLDFEVQIHQDLDVPTLEKLLLTVSEEDHTLYDAFVCVIMTHGKLGVLYMSDSKAIRILDIVEFFSDKYCPKLRGKPKMFFIQACQTGLNSEDASRRSTVAPDNVSETRLSSEETQCGKLLLADDNQLAGVSQMTSLEDGVVKLMCDASQAPNLVAAIGDRNVVPLDLRAALVPSSPDFVMSYATTPGSAAYRDVELGSLYIHELEKCLGQKLELDRALKLVTQGVRSQLKSQPDAHKVSRNQLPFHLTTGDKLIYL